MIDDQVNLEELEGMKRQRQAVQEATDDGIRSLLATTAKCVRKCAIEGQSNG